MPTVDGHVAVSAGVVGGFLNLLIGTLFDIPPAVVFVVFAGSFIGLLYRPAVEMPGKVADKFKLFAKTFVWLVAITMLASWLVPLLTHFAPQYAQKTLAAFAGFILMVRRDDMTRFIDFIVSKLGGKIK